MAKRKMEKSIAFLNGLPIAAAVISTDQRLAVANALFSKAMGADLLGRHFITAFRQPDVIEAIEQVFADGAPLMVPFQAGAHGIATSYDMHITAVDQMVMVSLIDRTDAENTGRLRTDFIANVSHELRTPLTALAGFIETLRGAARNDPAAQDRFLGLMDAEAGRMTQLVNELMTLSKLEGNGYQQPRAVIDLRDVVQAARNTLDLIAAKSDIALDCTLPDSAVQIIGDEGELRQVVINLVENALKYGCDGGRVMIAVDPVTHHTPIRGQGAKLTIADQGHGIAPHHIARLTERFYRVEAHRSRAVGGVGLGLAIVKHIVNRHRGRLKITSQSGQGTTITVILPA